MNRAAWMKWMGGALSLMAATSAWGQGVHIVAGDGTGDFLQLQQAIDAAASGDVILVRPFTVRYDPSVIDGKALTIVGEGDVRPGLKRVRIDNLPAGSVVSLRHLDIDGSSEFVGFPVFAFLNFDALGLTNDAGCVWLEDLVLHGANGLHSNSEALDGRTGLAATGSPCVVLARSEVRGGDGALSTGGTPHPGGWAARSMDVQLAVWGTTLLGGTGAIGGIATPFGAPGGVGVEVSSATVLISGSALTGGDTGSSSTTSAIPTASGLFLQDASSVQHLDTTFEAGAGPAPPGLPVATSGSPSAFDDLDDDHRQLTIAAAMRELEPAAVHYSGQPGDLVLLLISAEPDWKLLAGLKGVLHLDAMTSAVFLGVANSAGTLDLMFTGPLLPAGLEAVTGYAQPVVAESDTSLRLGAPSSILLLDASIPSP